MNKRRVLRSIQYLGAMCFMAVCTSIASAQAPTNGDSTKVDYNAFKDPALEFRGTRWFTFLAPQMTEESVKQSIDQAAASGAYGGWMATPDDRGKVPGGVSYLNDEFFRVYKIAIEEGLKKGLAIRVLYDEMQFPTGSAGGLLKAKYPDLIGRALDKEEKDVVGPAKVEIASPRDGTIFIGAVRMNRDTLECIDVTNTRASDKVAISCDVPAGNWKVMLFYLDGSANQKGLVDYLDPKAVDGLIEVMYQRYYDNLKEYFGNPIKMTFFDEPAMHHPEFKGRLWTPIYNAEFQKKFGFSPVKYYPALWYDIGPDTAAARNALYGFRADMYADNFIGRIAAWDEAHGVKMAGHLDQEEAPSPVATQGDLMKVFKHQQAPGHDDIWFTGRSLTSYKIMTSSAFNWDKPIAVAETYAAYYRGQYDTPEAGYRTALDQHAMGVNFQVGNYPSPQLGPEFGEFLGRMQYLLQHGKHMADIGVVYPIAAMQSAYAFASPVRRPNPPPAAGGARRGRGPATSPAAAPFARGRGPATGPATAPFARGRAGGFPGGAGNGQADFYYGLEGGIVPPEIDYMQLGELLYRGFRVDYTYLHPEIIENNSIILDKKLILNNRENREEFRILILPGGDTVNLGVAKKLLEFYNAGGTVVATSKLPIHSAEFGHDKEVRQIMEDLFGLGAMGPMTAEIHANANEFKTWFDHPNQAGGNAFFLPRIEPTSMADVLSLADKVRDVNINLDVYWPVKWGQDYDGAVTYIHKFKDGKDIYFFANSTNNAIDTQVVLRGQKKLAIWNPHTGEQSKAEAVIDDGNDTTTVRLNLDALRSTFFVSE